MVDFVKWTKEFCKKLVKFCNYENFHANSPYVESYYHRLLKYNNL
jgi:hypothetical protein